MNTLTVSGKEPELRALQDFTDTIPFFAEKRTVLLTDSGLFKGTPDGFPEWIESLPETACVIFCEHEIDKRSRLYKAVLKKGYAAEMNRPDEKMLSSWALRMIGDHKLSIRKNAFERLMEICDPDMQTMRNELLKLIDYCKDKGTIEIEDVDLLVTPNLSNRIFVLIEHVAEKRRLPALDLYYDLLALRESPMRILYLITRQLNQMMLVRKMTAEGLSQDAAAGILNVRPFVARKLLTQARRYRNEELQGFITLALELEEACKSGDLQENMAVELLIFRMTE